VVESQPSVSITNLGAIVMVLDGAGRITWVNNSWSAATGIPLDDAVDKPLLDFVVGQSEKQRIAGRIQSAAEQRQPVTFDCSVICRKGTDLRIKWSFTITRGHTDGELVMTGVGVDVTELYNEVSRLKRELSKQTQDTGQQASPTADERRSCERVPFEHVVQVAPVVDGRLPEADAFRPVRCKDLSHAGFSFFQRDCPDFAELVVIFGKQPKSCIIHAKIAHAAPVKLNGRRLFVVGCEFKTRVEKHYANSARRLPNGN
jgi:PAS domain S-box-containing protein